MNHSSTHREAELLRQQAVLARFGEFAVKSLSLDDILHEACQRVGSALGTDLAKVLEVQEDGNTLLVKAGVGWRPGIVGETTVPAEENTSEGYALATGKPVISVDIEKEDRLTYVPFLKEHGVKAFVNVLIPGLGEDRPYGILQVDSREPRDFAENDIHFLRGYANLIAASVARLHMHQSQQRAENRLRQSQKMEAIGQLTGGIAHDFNNMLAGIIGSLELLQLRIEQGRVQDVQRYAKAAATSANKAALLTSRLLSFSRQQTLEPKPLQPARLIQDLAEMFRRTLGPAIRLQTRLAPDSGSIVADAVQLENALLNLVINSRDAMSPGGSLIVGLDNAELDEAAAAQIELSAGRYVRLSVEDDGCGMPADIVDRACDPFFTTKPQGEGTGLGLSMVYGFAKQSGGSVQLHSRPGEGTRVDIYLPWHAPISVSRSETADRPTLPPAQDGECVLLVEDDEVVRETVSTLLDDLGYEVLQAEDADACLDQAQRIPSVDLLLSDVGLPGEMDGFALMEAVREYNPEIKVLLVTGFAKARDLGSVKPLQPGVHVLTKPFGIEALARRVREVLDERTG